MKIVGSEIKPLILINVVMKSMKFLSALSVAVLGAVACTKTQAPELEGVTVEPSQITVVKGETAELSFAVTPKDASWEGVYWQSSDETVATVDQDGVVTAVATGTAEISVHVDSFNDVCTVTVKGGPLESLVLNETALSLFVGGTSQLSFTYNPEDADFDPSSAKWSSADETVATVDGTGLVTAVGAGETTVTLTAGEITAECSVSVTGEASVGDFFYSDGTWSADLDPDKTCIGVVFYAGHHENDLSDYSSTGIGSVKCHGYVVALHDASPADCIHWGPNDVLLENYPLDEDGEPVVISNFTNNNDVQIIQECGPFQVIEYQRDLSVMPHHAQTAYFCNEMNIRKRQVICDVNKANIVVQAGAMQWMVGNVYATTGLKGVGDLLSKAVRGKVTGETAIKPEYTGEGILVLEPTYKHILLLDLDEWNHSVVLDDGLFLACDANLKHKAVMRSNLSSAAAGNVEAGWKFSRGGVRNKWMQLRKRQDVRLLERAEIQPQTGMRNDRRFGCKPLRESRKRRVRRSLSDAGSFPGMSLLKGGSS